MGIKFSGGEKLEARLREIAEGLEKGATLSVGFLEDATYPDGTPVALVAAINEFGSENAPPRPFFRNMIADRSSEWPEAIGDLLVAHDYDAEEALSLTGEGIAWQLEQAIADFSGVPLAPATVERKGFDKQLVDSGHMLSSVEYKVE